MSKGNSHGRDKKKYEVFRICSPRCEAGTFTEIHRTKNAINQSRNFGINLTGMLIVEGLGNWFACLVGRQGKKSKVYREKPNNQRPSTKPAAQPFNLKPDLVWYNYGISEILRQPEQ